MRYLSSLGRAIAVPAAVVALAFGLAACGDSDDGDAGASAAEEQQQALNRDAGKKVEVEATRTGSDVDQIVATLRYMPVELRAGHAKAFCTKLTRAGRKDLQTFLSPNGKRRPCPVVIAQVSKLQRRVGRAPTPVKVFSVDVKGNRATVKTQGGVAGRSRFTLRMEKEDGEWRLPDSAFTKEG